VRVGGFVVVPWPASLFPSYTYLREELGPKGQNPSV